MPILLLTLLKNGVETSTVTISAHSGIGVLSQQKLMTHAAKCISWADMITKTLNLIMIQFCMVFAVYAAPVQWIIKAFIANVLSAYFYRLNWVSGLWIGYKWARFQYKTCYWSVFHLNTALLLVQTVVSLFTGLGHRSDN